MLERQYCCGRLEVRVVVHHSEVMSGGESRGQQVRHSDGPVLAVPSEFSLRAQSGSSSPSNTSERCSRGTREHASPDILYLLGWKQTV